MSVCCRSSVVDLRFILVVTVIGLLRFHWVAAWSCYPKSITTTTIRFLSSPLRRQPWTRVAVHGRTTTSMSAFGTSTTTVFTTPTSENKNNNNQTTTTTSAVDGVPPPVFHHHILSYVQYLSDAKKDDGRIKLILASQSPRRREILDMMGLSGRYQVIHSPLQEEQFQTQLLQDPNSSSSPTEYTRRLAEEKAKALAQVLRTTTSSSSITTSTTTTTTTTATLVLGSDTIVELDGRILEKPKNVSDARVMLGQLSGRQHQVHTGVALYLVDDTVRGKLSDEKVQATTATTTTTTFVRLLSSFTDTAWVQFAVLSDQDIEAYLATGEPLDKAGSYGIQGVGGQFVTQIQGDFFTVMGLPAHRTSQVLAKAISELIIQDNQ